MLNNFLGIIFPSYVLRLLLVSATIGSLLGTTGGCDQFSGTSVVQIIGEVRMDRKPLADTLVAVVPLELRGPSGKITELAFGKTDDAGRFELRTSDARGVLPGEYRVLFFRPSPEAGLPPQTDDALEEKADGVTTGIPSDTALMLSAVDRLGAFSQAKPKRSSAMNVGEVPLAYNLQSTIRLTVKPGAGIIYPKFELDAHPKN